MSTNLSNELSSLRTTVITAKDDINLLRDLYEPNALATQHSLSGQPEQGDKQCQKAVAETAKYRHVTDPKVGM